MKDSAPPGTSRLWASIGSVLLRGSVPPKNLDRPLDPPDLSGTPAQIGMGALHEVAVPPLHLFLRRPASAEPRRVDSDALDPEDPQRRLDPAGLQVELPDVGLEGRGGRVRLDVEPRVAPPDRGARLMAVGAGAAQVLLPPRPPARPGALPPKLLSGQTPP